VIAPKLVRHPAPFATESLPGYVLRLTELNGYGSPRSIYKLAGMNATESSLSKFDCSKLAAIANQPVEMIERIAFNSKRTRSLDLLGKPAAMDDLNLTRARHCPDCVTGKGFIEAHWHVDCMVACPVHGKAAVWFCPKCKSGLSWIRTGLLRCGCGTELLDVPLASYSNADFLLLDVVRSKVLGDRIDRINDCGMPYEQLVSMELHDILRLVYVMGRTKLGTIHSEKARKGKHLLRAAAWALTDWPSNFQKILTAIYPNLSGISEVGSVTHTCDLQEVQRVLDERFSARYARLNTPTVST
jgi:TniQ